MMDMNDIVIMFLCKKISLKGTSNQSSILYTKLSFIISSLGIVLEIPFFNTIICCS